MSSELKETFKQQTRSVRELVYEVVKDRILSGHYKSGHHLNERELAREFEVSTTPIKEALRHLEQEGLVITQARKGTFVSDNIMNSVEEINLARAALEGVATRLATLKITDDELNKLESVIREMEHYTKEKNNVKVSENNILFHNLIREAARNNYILQQIKAVQSFDPFFRQKALRHNDEIDRAFNDHYLILKKIKEKDPEGAEEAMRRHIYRTTEFVKSKVESN